LIVIRKSVPVGSGFVITQLQEVRSEQICSMTRFYITTAIDYANGPPHLGHAYEKVLTDVVARYRRAMGYEVHFVTGLDEHGQKVQQAVRKEDFDEQEFVDRIAVQFRDLCARLNISNDDFIRTTEERHKGVVQQILQDLYDRGDIYLAEYKGFYSVRQEQFVFEREKVDGAWPEIYGEVTELSESNYFFRLAKYQDWLVEYLQTHDFVFPRFRQKQILEFLKEPLNDLCISRPRERLNWGISLPFDPDYVCYVWFDALINYISAVGYGTESFDSYWPVDYHVIGKDILVPSHSVYWPIMLKAIGLEPPQSLLVHGWWHISGQKLSKSTGITIDPLELADRFGADAFRYFVTREMSVGQDSDFSPELFLSRYNSDLANDLGNLVSRLLNLTSRHCPDGFPPAGALEQPERDLREHWDRTCEEALRLYEGFQFHTALEKTFAFITGINRYAEIRAPWKLAKSQDPADAERMRTVYAMMGEGLRLATALLVPVMPETASRIYGLLGLGEPGLWKDELAWSTRLDGRRPGEKAILFPKPQP